MKKLILILLIGSSVTLVFAGKSISDTSGDGISAPFVSYTLSFADSGDTITIEGNVKALGGSMVAITGSPLTAPPVPGSGSNYFIIQVDTTAGTASVKTLTSGYPTPDAGAIQIFQDIRGTTDSNLSQDLNAAPVNEW